MSPIFVVSFDDDHHQRYMVKKRMKIDWEDVNLQHQSADVQAQRSPYRGNTKLRFE